MVRLWRQAWDGQDLEGLLPPARHGGPPVWLAAGDSPKVLERVAKTYDGWLPYLPDPDAYRRAWERISELAVREITPALYATVNINDDRPKAHQELDAYTRAYYRQPFDVMGSIQAFRGGPVDKCVDWLGGFVDAGVRHLVLRIGSADSRPEMIGERLLPELRSVAPLE